MEKVLIVEDDPVTRKFIAKAVEGLSLIPLVASDGEEGWAALEQTSDIRIVITDMMMPKMTGREFIERLRKSDAHKHLPILMVSAYVGPREISDLLAIGASRFMLKPLHLAELQEEIKILLRYAELPSR